MVWLYGPTLVREAHTATAYAARVGCSCRYVAGRPLQSCRRDFVARMGLVTLGEDAAARSVTARYALLAPTTATYRDGAGCILEAWRR